MYFNLGNSTLGFQSFSTCLFSRHVSPHLQIRRAPLLQLKADNRLLMILINDGPFCKITAG